jgi:hypothetical protein
MNGLPQTKIFLPVFLAILAAAAVIFAGTPEIRVNVESSTRNNGNDTQMVSALSHEFRKLDGVLVTDTKPALNISCAVVPMETMNSKQFGYAASIAITAADGRLITHSIQTDHTIDAIAHTVAISVDGRILEQLRRAAQESSSR